MTAYIAWKSCGTRISELQMNPSQHRVLVLRSNSVTDIKSVSPRVINRSSLILPLSSPFTRGFCIQTLPRSSNTASEGPECVIGSACICIANSVDSGHTNRHRFGSGKHRRKVPEAGRTSAVVTLPGIYVNFSQLVGLRRFLSRTSFETYKKANRLDSDYV